MCEPASSGYSVFSCNSRMCKSWIVQGHTVLDAGLDHSRMWMSGFGMEAGGAPCYDSGFFLSEKELKMLEVLRGGYNNVYT